MMFSMEKCLGRSGNGTAESGDLFAGGGEGMGKEGVAPDEVASAVAAVSDEIGDILKDELGDADRADRIGAELADLSAELGLLAGLADGEPQQDFPSLFEIAMGHRGSGSGSSSSSWSGGRGGRPRRHSRPQRAPRRRPIAKGKEISRRRSAAARRAACMRLRRVEVVSDASDVGADSDSDDQWTELDDATGSSDSSSMKEAAGLGDMDCNGYQHKAAVEAPAMGQFLLPLLSAEATTPDPEHFLIRHEDILQLLASTEEVRDDIPLDDDTSLDNADMLSSSDMIDFDDTPVTPEEEAALLHYVCEGGTEGSSPQMSAVAEWLLGVFHSWCEISALIFTLLGTNMSVEMVTEEWVYRARFGCHCRACLCLANSAEALAAFLRDVVWALAHCTSTVGVAARVVRALGAAPHEHGQRWDLPRLCRALRSAPLEGAAIIHEQLCKLSRQNDTAHQIVTKICLCRQFDKPMEPEYAVERFCKILENFKAASTITFKVEMIPVEGGEWVRSAGGLSRYLRPHSRASTADRLRDMAARTTPHDLSAWSGYKHRCDCLTPRTLCAQQRKQLLRISFFGMMQVVNEFNGAKSGTVDDVDKPPNEMEPEANSELQHGDGTGAKPPEDDTNDSIESCDSGSGGDSGSGDTSGDSASLDRDKPHTDHDDDLSVSECEGASLGLSSSSSGGSVSGGAPGELCRTVRHLMRSIASIERLMDRVLQHCDQWPDDKQHADTQHRKRVDMGLSEVDRKLMAMYKRLPEVHRRQLQVYRKQKKLSTVCMQLVGGVAPLPPPPGSPPPAAPPQPCRALCPEYHLQRFKEVRRKVMHMRDQQLYYHRLRMWLEDQLRQERESLPDSNVTLIEDLTRSKRRTSSPKVPRLSTAPKRKLKPASPSISKPHKILQMLKHKAPEQTTQLLTDGIKTDDDITKSEAEPPEAFPLEREDNISDTETIVGEKETDLCKEMKECLAKFSNFALSTPESETKYPESVSPPLQEMSPTTPEPLPVYTSKPNQRLLTVNKFLKEDEFTTAPDVLNIPLNARRTPLLVKEDKLDMQDKDPNIYKYVSFGLEIKKAMEECQNIINSYKSIKETKKDDGQLSLEHICEVMMTLDKNSAEFLDKVDTDEPLDMNAANSKLAELVENMPQILANMPEIASKLSEFANASFELPEFASIMNSLPDVNNEAQLTPETLKQIRELKLNKARDSVKVTKNTIKRKTPRRIKNNIESNDLIGTMTFELDNKDIVEFLKDEKDLQTLVKNKNKEDFKDLLFSISAQVVINKVFEYLKQNKSPDLAKCLQDKELLSLPCLNTEMCTKASTLFDNSVKDALSMDDLRDLVKSRFNSWKHYVATKIKSIPLELLENEIEAMLDKFYSYIQDLAGKNHAQDSDRIVQKIDDLRKTTDFNSDSDSKDSVKQILLTTSVGHTLDILIMKYPKLAHDKKYLAKGLKFKYTNILTRCVESQPLANWLMADPELAITTIQELVGFEVKKPEYVLEFSTMSMEKKRDYFIDRLKVVNKQYMESLPKKALSGDEWLVMLYKLEQYEVKLKETLTKLVPTVKTTQNASEAEILAAKGLSKIIGKASIRVVKKTEPQKKKEESPTEMKEDEKKCKNDALLAKCEAILTSKGEKSLLDSFYTIKSYITQGLPVPETYKQHVISICSSIDAKLLDEDLQDSLRSDRDDSPSTPDSSKEKGSSQNHEDLAKYSAQALRNAKQTLNAVAFKNISRNGNSKSESDVCDTPKTDCKWTNDCSCSSCKDNEFTALCLSSNISNIVQKCIEFDKKDRKERREGKKPVAKPKPVPKVCENGSHQQHICKVGHGGSACAGDGADQPCTCCYCTVFGHAPPLTTPVPPKYNETRERLRSILNKKKQQCKTANMETEPPAVVQPQAVEPPAPKPQVKPPAVAPKPPALPKTQPPSLTPAQVQQKRNSIEQQQRQLADKMAKMVVTEKPNDAKPKALQRTVPIQVNMPAALKAEGKVNPNAMEQIRLQQLKQAQQAQYQQQLQQQQQQAQQQQQKKPEPIYDLPIHNKPTLTAQQQQQIRQQQQQLQQKLQQQQAAQQQQLAQQTQQHEQELQQQQQQHAQQQAQQLAQQQQAQQMRQTRQQKQRNSLPIDSRDSSVFSTSSGCSAESWQKRGEDPRDLDALLQYIEGPSRHIDRGKKRAKKQRQKAKKVEARLSAELSVLAGELSRARGELWHLTGAHDAAEVRVRRTRKLLDAHHKPRRKGKNQKLNPDHQAKMQLAEQLKELTMFMNQTAKGKQAAESQVMELTRRLQQCERQLADVRALQGNSDTAQEQERIRQHQIQDRYEQHHLEQQRLEEKRAEHEHKMSLLNYEKAKRQLERDNATATFMKAARTGNIVCVRRSPGDGAVTLSIPEHDHLMHYNNTVTTVHDDVPTNNKTKPPVEARKQTWEQALAHINQLAKGPNKEKKKQQKEVQNKVQEQKKKEPQRSNSLPEPNTLSKKQRKLLAKQEAEEEEKKKQQQNDNKNKKTESKKPPEHKQDTKIKKEDKKTEQNKKESVKKKEEKKTIEKTENKKEKVEKKIEKKGKENKQEKIAPTKQPTPQPSQPQKKKEMISPETTLTVVGKKTPCGPEPETVASCSIMQQLSCGVQVADLKLPPGITLTRVQPMEKIEPPPIKSVPLWKCNQLAATPTPVARPAPVIAADPALRAFSTARPEPPKPVPMPEPSQPVGKSKKAKKKAKKAAAAAEIAETKPEGAKMVTLRNPMFHPNLPPVQISTQPSQKKQEQIRIPDPIPMPPNACQATITPTSNGMYTIRNPLMSMMHQQSLLGMRAPSPQINPMYSSQYNYVNPNVYPVQNPNQFVIESSRNSPKQDDIQSRIMNLASFTQKNDEGYSLFKTTDDNQQRNFLAPNFENKSPNPVVSPNPIGTRPVDSRFDSSESSLFANPIQRPEPIGTPLKKDEERNEYTGLYTPFGQEDKNVFRNALFSDKNDCQGARCDDTGLNPLCNGDSLPYFQRLRVGSKLNNEVTIHHVTESKFYKTPEAAHTEESLFSRQAVHGWNDQLYNSHTLHNNNTGVPSGRSTPVATSLVSGVNSAGASPPDERRFGPVGARPPAVTSVFLPDSSITNLSSLEVSEREIESFKRFDFYFEPPQHKPKVQLDVRDIANALRHNNK